MKSSFLAAAVVASAATASQAGIWNLSVSLNGLNEVPPNNSPGTGVGVGTLDDVTGAVSISGTFQNLMTNAQNAHVHGLGPVGTNAGVIFGLTFTPSTSGNWSGNGVLTPAQITGMINGLTYVNIHSVGIPGGEIRGQIAAVPAPPGLALLGLAGLAAFRRRR